MGFNDDLLRAGGEGVLRIRIRGVRPHLDIRGGLDTEAVTRKGSDDGSPGDGVEGQSGDYVFGIGGGHLLTRPANPTEEELLLRWIRVRYSAVVQHRLRAEFVQEVIFVDCIRCCNSRIIKFPRRREFVLPSADESALQEHESPLRTHVHFHVHEFCRNWLVNESIELPVLLTINLDCLIAGQKPDVPAEVLSLRLESRKSPLGDAVVSHSTGVREIIYETAFVNQQRVDSFGEISHVIVVRKGPQVYAHRRRCATRQRLLR